MKIFLFVLLTAFLHYHSKSLKKKMNNYGKHCSSNCKVCESGKCTKCERGLYSFRNSCFESCPFNTFADNISLSCVEKGKNPFYLKSYTRSRCINSCGKVFQECSCHPNCEKTGECCSDYQICEIIEKSHSTDCIEPNCKLCTKDRKVCLQCKENFFYNDSKCIIKCPENTLPNSQNICENTKDSNCSQGLFFHKGKCIKSCPVGLRANRIDFTCKTDKEFSFYWIYPSRESCENKCGDNTKSDCSCKYTCLRRGNCCDDFEKECREEMKKEKCTKLCDTCIDGNCKTCKPHSTLNAKKKCECIKNYLYNMEEDICVTGINKKFESLEDNLKILENFNRRDLTDSQNIFFLDKTQVKLKQSYSISNPSNVGLDLNTHNKPLFFTSNATNSSDNNNSRNYSHLSTSLTSHLKSTFFKLLDMIKSNPETKSNPMAFYLNGNISFNVMNDNIGTRIINRHNLRINSNNINAKRIENVNSHNNLNKITKQGNVVKSVNNGGIYQNNVIPKNHINDEKIYRKLDLNNKNKYIYHEQVFGDPSSLELKSPQELTKFENNSIENSSLPIPTAINQEQPVFNNTLHNPINTDENLSNNTIITIPTTNNSDNFNQNDLQPNQTNDVDFQTYPSSNFNQTLHKLSLEPNSTIINYKNSSSGTDPNALIIGRGNIVKNNHLIHNIITVHNSYIIPAHNFSRLMNNSEHRMNPMVAFRRVFEVNKQQMDKREEHKNN